MVEKLKVLVVEDSEDDTLLLVRELKKGGFSPEYKRVEIAEGMREALSQENWDIVISDYKMPHFSGLKALEILKDSGLEIPFILVSGTIGEDLAVEAMKAGASDYVMKEKIARLNFAVEREMREAIIRRERKTMEMAKRESENKYRQLVENAQEGIWVIDVNAKTTFVNPKMADLFGYTVEEMMGRHLFTFMDEQGVDIAKIELDHRKEGINEHHDFEFIRKDGNRIYTSLETSPIIDDTGKYVGILALVTDITMRRRAEEEKQNMQFQLIQSEKMAAVGQLASSVVHELSNPLMAVTVYSSMLEEQLKSPKINIDKCLEMLEMLKEGSIRCEKVVKNLLEFTRQSKHEHRLINLNESLNSTISLLKHKAGMEKIRINRKLQENIQQISADNNELQQVFMNLIVNAFDAMKGGGTLTVESRQIDSEHVEFSIIDTGEGIPKDNMPKIFEPFFTTKSSEKGTGLGLPIVKKIIEEHGGEIRVKSEVGKGTTFTITIPVNNEKRMKGG